MFAKIPVLLILSLIISFSICPECITSTNDDSPKYDSCFAILLPNKYCCFHSGNGSCIAIETGKLKSSSSNGIICQISEEIFGKYEFEQYHPKHNFDSKIGLVECGKYNPSKKEDCTDYSELANSCCYFKNTNGDKACFHIGRKYLGDFKEKSTNINGISVTYECKSFNIVLSLCSILLIILLL